MGSKISFLLSRSLSTVLLLAVPLALLNFQNCGRASMGTIGGESRSSVGALGPEVPVDPNLITCPTGQLFTAVSGGVISCRTILPNTVGVVTCPAGTAIVGIDSLQHVICQSMMSAPFPESVCPAGQFALNSGPDNGSPVSCVPLPVIDFGQYCPIGQYLSSISSTGFTCDTIAPGSLFTGTCAAGTSLQGFSTGTAVCSVLPNVIGNCARGTFPSGLRTGVTVCSPFSPVPQACLPGAIRSCNSSATQTCSAAGAWGACVVQK